MVENTESGEKENRKTAVKEVSGFGCAALARLHLANREKSLVHSFYCSYL